MQRVLIVGCGGAGKSSFARALGATLGLEVLHLDSHFWKAGWVEPSQAEWQQTLTELVQKPAWIMDGTYSKTLALRLTYADTVIFLDMPRWLCLWRVAKRVLRHRGRTRPDMAADCPERFSWEFMGYVWNFHRQKRPRLLQWLAVEAAQKQVIVLRSPYQVQFFLHTLAPDPKASDLH